MATRTAMMVEMVVVEITKTATDNAPMYIAVEKAKKRAKHPPAAAKDTRSEMIIAFTVAATKNNIKTSSPVKATSVIDPTCQAK